MNSEDNDLQDITIPKEFIALCSGWAGDCNCMLRAINSTGGLTLGRNRPQFQDSERAWRGYTDREWQVSLFSSLVAGIRYCIGLAEKSTDPDNAADLEALRAFETFAKDTANELREAYGLTESDVV